MKPKSVQKGTEWIINQDFRMNNTPLFSPVLINISEKKLCQKFDILDSGEMTAQLEAKTEIVAK